MCIIPGKLSSSFLTGLLAALILLTHSGHIYAQSRSFQMGLWAAPTDPGPVLPQSADTDIAVFYEGQSQPPPPIRSIAILGSWATAPLSANGYDWSRIVAVEIDEPYYSTLKDRFGGDQSSNPGCDIRPDRLLAVLDVMQTLANRSAELAALSPLARFWVNFTDHEVDWMRDSRCPLALNQPNIDVISVDVYYKPFSSAVQTYYDWFIMYPATPHQQLALIPGTFHRTGTDKPPNAQQSADFLPGYFTYAETKNQSCNLSLGTRGVTGYYDRCRVWIVVGFLARNYMQENDLYMGEQDPSSAPIATAWRAKLTLPIRPDLANQRTPAQIIPAILPQLLN